jgi:hypothetical protein
MQKLIFSSLTFFLLSSFTGFSQDDLIIIDRGALKRSSSTKKEIKLNDNISAIKFSPTQMIMGEINFSWERQLSQKSSIELSAGPTISNIGFGIQSHLFDPYGGSIETSGVGLFGEVGIRYYPLDETEALNRFYVSPILKFRQFNFGLDDISDVLASTDGSDVQLNFLFNFGYQLWASKSFAVDFFGGMGIGMRTINSAYVEAIWANNQYEYQWIRTRNSNARYVFSAGIKVGIGQKAK